MKISRFSSEGTTRYEYSYNTHSKATNYFRAVQLVNCVAVNAQWELAEDIEQLELVRDMVAACNKSTLNNNKEKQNANLNTKKF